MSGRLVVLGLRLVWPVAESTAIVILLARVAWACIKP